MKRLLVLMMAWTLGAGAHAVEPDRLNEALEILRGRVVFVDASPEARLMSAGYWTGVAGAGGLGAYVIFKMPPNYLSNKALGRWLLGGSVGTIGLAAGLAATSLYLRQHHPSLPPAVQSVDYYRTVKGFNAFIGLAPEQQVELAQGNPEFAEFILALADAYTTVVSTQLPRVP